jgi:hypothetical protein
VYGLPVVSCSGVYSAATVAAWLASACWFSPSNTGASGRCFGFAGSISGLMVVNPSGLWLPGFFGQGERGERGEPAALAGQPVTAFAYLFRAPLGQHGRDAVAAVLRGFVVGTGAGFHAQPPFPAPIPLFDYRPGAGLLQVLRRVGFRLW